MALNLVSSFDLLACLGGLAFPFPPLVVTFGAICGDCDRARGARLSLSCKWHAWVRTIDARSTRVNASNRAFLSCIFVEREAVNKSA